MDPMFVSLAVGAFVLVAVLSQGGPPRIRRFRGPMWGSVDEVQFEHLRLFARPRQREDEEED